MLHCARTAHRAGANAEPRGGRARPAVGFVFYAHDAKVDEAAARGRAAGVEVSGPVDAGGVVGYYCLLADPDGNWIEFSFGQSLGEQP